MMAVLLTYLRVISAIAIVAFPTVTIIVNLFDQHTKPGFDGPLAWHHSYTFAFNEIFLAFVLAIILVTNFKMSLTGWKQRLFQIIAMFALLLIIMGAAFLAYGIYWTGMSPWPHFEVIFYQFVYFLVALVLVGKAFGKTWSEMTYKGNSNA